MHLIFIATACFGLTKFRDSPKIKCACLLSKASDRRGDIWAQMHSLVRNKMVGASSKGPDLFEEPDKTTRMANTLPCKVVFDLGGGSWNGASKNKERWSRDSSPPSSVGFWWCSGRQYHPEHSFLKSSKHNPKSSGPSIRVFSIRPRSIQDVDKKAKKPSKARTAAAEADRGAGDEAGGA